MKDYSISSIFTFLIAYIKRQLKLQRTDQNDIFDEWENSVNSAELNADLFNEANDQEKEDLVLYFTHKLLRRGDYSKESLEQLPTVLKVAYLVNKLDAEVNNGGFTQFFTNSSGEFTNETIASLGLIKADFTKKLLTEALDVMIENNESHATLNSRMSSKEMHVIFEASEIFENEKLMNQMSELDSKYYEYTDSISTLKLDFIKENEATLWAELKAI